MNLVGLSGRIVKEIKISGGDKKATNFTLAVTNYHKKDEKGNYDADFLPIVCFGKTADYIASNGEQSQEATVKGEIHTDRWTDNDGNKHSIQKIYADTVELGRKAKSSGGQSNNSNSISNEGAGYNENFFPTEDDEDLPF